MDWFQNPKNIQENFDKIRSSPVSEKKVPKHVYYIFNHWTII